MIDRRLLYWGVFLVTAGAVMLIARSGALESAFVADALRLWPILVIGLGAGLLLRATRFSVAGGMLTAAMPGLLLGGLVVAAPNLSMDCRIGDPASYTTQAGTFDGSAAVDLRIDCGDLSVTTAPGTGWRVQTGDTTGAAPSVVVSPDRISVRSADQHRRFATPWGGDAFRVTLPTDASLDLAAEVNAGRGTLALSGAQLRDLRLDVNAGDLRVDLAGATLTSLSMDVNAAAASVRLPAGADFTADLTVNAAKLSVCVPAGLGLRIHQEGTLGATSYAGQARDGGTWETPGYSTTTHHADVTVSVNVGSVDIDPEGGCK